MHEEPKWRSGADLVIPHPTRRQLLAQQVGEQWRLPNMAIDHVWDKPIGRINAEMQRHFGLETTVVRQILEHEDRTQELAYYLYLLENNTTDWLPPEQVRWLDMTDIDQLAIDHPEQRTALLACLHEITTGNIPRQRALWERPGWYQGAAAWIHEQLTQLGNPPTGPVEQVKHWFLSCILRAPTAQGLVYFKATNGSSLMVNEAVLTQALARRFPRAMPQPLTINPTCDWMLLADFGSEIGWEATIETREAALAAFAQLQMASAARVDELLNVGCIDRRLSRLAEQIALLLNDQEVLALVEPAQQQQLLAAAPRLAELCVQMAQYNVPATLVHGDLHMSNIARRGEQFVFFDWSDACIAHPFLDMIAVLHEKDNVLQTRLRDAYLAHWTGYEPMDRLLALWQMAYPLCALHQAVSYRYIAQHVETGYSHPMIRWAMPYWFGKILEAL
jgi:hypothetical protein